MVIRLQVEETLRKWGIKGRERFQEKGGKVISRDHQEWNRFDCRTVVSLLDPICPIRLGQCFRRCCWIGRNDYFFYWNQRFAHPYNLLDTWPGK